MISPPVVRHGSLGGLALILLGIVRLSRSLRQHRSEVPESPREILDRRYAEGEINEDEYLTHISGLTQN